MAEVEINVITQEWVGPRVSSRDLVVVFIGVAKSANPTLHGHN
jgi:hypothetical protein